MGERDIMIVHQLCAKLEHIVGWPWKMSAHPSSHRGPTFVRQRPDDDKNILKKSRKAYWSPNFKWKIVKYVISKIIF